MRKIIALLLVVTPFTQLVAQNADATRFTNGPVFSDFGPVADVESDYEIAPDIVLKVAFDVTARSEDGRLNRQIEIAARFINMHVRVGLPRENVQPALVVHGPAVMDLLSEEAYAERFDGEQNPNLPLIKALLDYGVPIIVCGQSAAGSGIAKAELAPGVTMALSAITAHAMLQQQGYTLNPF